jgi:hypothetical protein
MELQDVLIAALIALTGAFWTISLIIDEDDE